jgi:aspartyl-tRNA(Asn)/glutamyl-tRNA(Gln) amidotransferase subunit B
MEVHAELKTNSKMFCGCKNDPFGAAEPNIYTCPVCLGVPGALPVANQKAIEWTIKLGLALGCKINLFSKFDRKHYFYPDLPKGYQISQYDLPFCYDGVVETSFGPVRIRRIHLEEDTGKLLHKEVDGEKVSLIDFNRSSVPLVEIVTEPDIKSPEQAKEYGKNLRQMLRHLNIADCDMEQGGMRLEANISLTTQPGTLPNYKVEVKNINSFKFLEQAITYEMTRHQVILDSGETPAQETRGFNPQTNKTFAQRTKEDAEDYRYFPDPDIPPLVFTEAQIEQWRSELPEMPAAVVARWQSSFGVEPRFGEELIKENAQLSLWEELFSQAKAASIEAGKLASDIVNKKITITTDTSAASILADFQKLHASSTVDEATLTTIISAVIAENPAEVARFQAGESKLLNFFVGQVMKTAKQKLDVPVVQRLLQEALQV